MTTLGEFCGKAFGALMRRQRALALSVVFLAGSAVSAHSAELTAEDPSSEWVFSVAPYGWGAGISGDVGLFGRKPIELDLKFSDILENLKFAAMGVAEAHNGTFGVFVDAIYVHTEDDEEISRSVNGLPARLDASVDTENLAATFMGEYRVVNDAAITLDLMAGIRLWDVKNDISAKLEVGGAELAQFSGDDGDRWVDPMAGIKTRINTDTPLYLTGWGMIGGGGVGSHLTWDVMGGIGYQWTGSFSTVVGYRALGVDYSNDGFVYDVVEQGPFLGGVFRF